MSLSTYDTLLAEVRARLTPGSAEHSERVAETAARLAIAYGEDTEEARIAGLLHDWCRDVPKTELIDRARELGMNVTGVDLVAPYLLHGPVGAAEVAERFEGLSSRIISAIETHTYGSADLDTLGMIVYVADTIEPARSHDGVEELRAAVGHVSLVELFARTYALSLRHLVESRRPIHRTTVDAWNAVIAGVTS